MIFAVGGRYREACRDSPTNFDGIGLQPGLNIAGDTTSISLMGRRSCSTIASVDGPSSVATLFACLLAP